MKTLVERLREYNVCGHTVLEEAVSALEAAEKALAKNERMFWPMKQNWFCPHCQAEAATYEAPMPHTPTCIFTIIRGEK